MANDLKNRWLNLTSHYDMPKPAAEAMFRVIKAHYSEPHRAYHTLNHLREVFEKFDGIKTRLENPDNVAFAVFFHDIIYNPTKGDNEQQSAEFARPLMEAIPLPADQIQIITDMILATQTHQCADHESDTAYMLDIDMSILAASKARYGEYIRQIGEEFSFMPAAEFHAARRDRFLIPCLKQDKIFHTEYFNQKLEDRARANIAAEIELIGEGLANKELAEPSPPSRGANLSKRSYKR